MTKYTFVIAATIVLLLASCVTNRPPAIEQTNSNLSQALFQYKESINRIINEHWTKAVNDSMDILSISHTNIQFTVSKDGEIKNILPTENAHSILAALTIRVLLSCHFPRIPEELYPLLKNDSLEFSYGFSIQPLQRAIHPQP